MRSDWVERSESSRDSHSSRSAPASPWQSSWAAFGGRLPCSRVWSPQCCMEARSRGWSERIDSERLSW